MPFVGIININPLSHLYLLFIPFHQSYLIGLEYKNPHFKPGKELRVNI